MRKGARWSLVGLVAAFALLTGCTNEGDGGGGQDAAPGSQNSDSNSGESGKSGAGVEKVDLEKVIVEQTVALPDNPEDKLKLGVLSLRVEGKVMILRMAVTPQFASASDSKAISLFSALGDSFFKPKLIDATHFKEYSTIGTASGAGGWKVNETEVESRNDSPMLAWAYFSAPEDDISSIDLRLDDNFPAFTDVPITR